MKMGAPGAVVGEGDAVGSEEEAEAEAEAVPVLATRPEEGPDVRCCLLLCCDDLWLCRGTLTGDEIDADAEAEVEVVAVRRAKGTSSARSLSDIILICDAATTVYILN